ncbi:MAG: glycoside hydrolase family 28 protein [Bacteroidetes bacterium]|nr:glycoside hydrolase family 28 protein [Bacteroidota bacterium]MBU1116939.1 glycoside hydrolase family 28 protein [Bacteroidota bacterium]MBU1799112.1 glycoside hydrolase family 28 protein [Bacteroidota bacterium]
MPQKNTIISSNQLIEILLILSIIVLTGITSLAQNKNEVNVLSYGAVPDGKTLNQIFIQKAIDEINNIGGGKVIIPKGKFLSGSIILKTNVELCLEKEAVLLGSTNPYNYSSIGRWKALVLAEGQDNISITGDGIIDGQGRKLALNADSLFYAGNLDSTFYNLRRKRPNEYMRPQLIEFVNCSNIKVIGVTIKDASSWVQSYEKCKNLKIDNITVDSDAYWNNDGIDIIDCKNVSITNSSVNSADDGICLKSEYSETFNDSIYIANCIVRSSASAIKFGTSSKGGFKNVKIENIKVYDTFRSAIALESVDGGILENIEVNNIFAVNTGNAIFIKLGHRNKDGKVGTLKNIHISNIRVQIPFETPDLEYDIRGPQLGFFHNPFPASITGMPGYFIENVVLENIDIIYPGRGNDGLAIIPLNRLNDVPESENEYPEFHMFGELPAWAFYVRHVKGLKMKNINVRAEKPDYRPAFVFDDVSDLTLNKIEINEEANKHQIILNNVSDQEIDERTSQQILELNK